ncbi:hypothetical protein AWC38_SpisGene7581 [Stylophora pistillata]|uniref:TNFR-Cys domain-containing protein n=1 Tax=Stylophora pistillata TaxID=50429 RepID=A0A2B4SGJ0_STYPI|nr:hypothetical protein AWC38_SpisGene7581 [Stylophora pistillata]
MGRYHKLCTILNIPQTKENPDATWSASSYQILGGHNSVIGCKECPDCPPGQQPTPPCGSKVQPDELINCTVCPSKTFKARNGDNKQVSQIDGNLESSFPEKSKAVDGFENILVKQLEVENSWKKVGRAFKIDQDGLDYWENGKSMGSPATGELLKKLKATHPEFTIADLIDQGTHFSPLTISTEPLSTEGTMIPSWQNMAELRIVITVLFILGFVSLLWVWNFWEDSDEFYPDGLDRCPPETYTINEDASRRIRCFDCPVCPTGEEPSPPCGITLTAKPSVQEENPVSSQMSPGENYITFQRTVALPKEVTEVRQVTPHMEGAQNEFLNSPLGSFTGTILAAIFVGLLVLFVYILYKKCVSKMLKGRKKFKRTSSDPTDFHHKEYYSVVGTLDTSERERLVNETTNETHDEASTVTVSPDLNLAEIPPDLLDKLVMRLDVPQAEKSITQGKTFGWQTVGKEVGIPQTELKYYEHLGRHASESPTKMLLDKMGSQGKTISDLVDVLNKPKLKLGNVAETIIRHRVTRI